MNKTVRFKQPILVCVGALLTTFGLHATPVCPSTGTYESLILLVSCQDGDKIFSDFAFHSSSSGLASMVDAADISYDLIAPVAPPAAPGFTSPNEWGFSFSGFNLTARGQASGSHADVTLFYNISIAPGNSEKIISAEAANVGSASGLGGGGVTEKLCPGETFATCRSFLTFDTEIGGRNTTIIPPETLLGVIKDLNVVAFGTFSSQAHISQLKDTVDQTVIPEPGFYGVLGVGLGAILMFAQRRKKAA